jgi:hypothetical protein
LLQDENKVAVAMSKTAADERFAQATDGRSLRNILINCSDTSPLLFVLSQFESSLLSSMPHWDSENVANGMAINRMNTLIETVQKLTKLKVHQSTVQIETELNTLIMFYKQRFISNDFLTTLFSNRFKQWTNLFQKIKQH